MRSYYTTGSSNGVTPVIKIGNSLPRFCGPGYPIVVLANKWTGGRKYHNSLISIKKMHPGPGFPICGMVIALTMQNPRRLHHPNYAIVDLNNSLGVKCTTAKTSEVG